MSLASGHRLGAYEVLALIGAGGMGEVYRARDTKLNRDVALKVLPEAFALDSERLARFKREAQVLASLNHPNIAAIHGFEDSSEVHALVLELVEGPTLADRIAQGALPMDEALPIARQIAEALEAAHEQGIVHRDLKPANIKLRPDGMVKVLDFGLAKAFGPAEAGHYVQPGAGAGFSRPDTMSPTITSPAMMTSAGMILGTAAYMSPEQARGKAVDKRTDVWAFGCVLYEMLTSTRAFGGDEITDTLAFIITKEADWKTLPPATPPEIRRLLRRCLEKDRKERLADISVARLDIRDALAAPTVESASMTATVPRRRQRLAWALTGVFALATLALGGVVYLQRTPTATEAYRSQIALPEGVRFVGTPVSRFALSPDGRRLVFAAADASGRQLLWVRPLDTLVDQPMTGTDGGLYPCWSADSRFVAFRAQQKLKRIDVAGGPPLTLADAPAGATCTWNSDDVIVFRPAARSPLHGVAATGGVSVPVTMLDAQAGDTEHTLPFFLPDGRHFLYVAIGSKTGGANEPRGIYVGSLDTNEKHALLVEGGSNAAYAQGHLIFLRENILVAQPFDAGRRQLSGEPVPIASDIARGGLTGVGGAFSASENGVVAYEAGSGGILSQLLWFDRSGKQLAILGEPGDVGDVAVAPDGARVSVSMTDAARNTRDLWIYDVARALRTRLTFDPANEFRSIWSPDGSRIVFNSQRKGSLDLYEKLSNGTGTEDVVLASRSNADLTDISSDGRYLLYNTIGGGGTQDVWLLPLADRKPVPFVEAPFNQGWGRFSPDGRWVAYVSNESGRNEIYVVPFQGAGGKWQVSTSGGRFPRWRRDGRELYYLAPDNRIMAAGVNARESRFEVGAVQPLFAIRPRLEVGWPYDVSGDAPRFLVSNLVEDVAPSSVTLLVNWPALLAQ